MKMKNLFLKYLLYDFFKSTYFYKLIDLTRMVRRLSIRNYSVLLNFVLIGMLVDSSGVRSLCHQSAARTCKTDTNCATSTTVANMPREMCGHRASRLRFARRA